MFKDDGELESWAEAIGLSNSTRSLVKTIRESAPARRVRSGPFNVGGRFARSHKMNYVVQHESRTVEFPALLLMELDYLYAEDDVIEIWDQPPSFIVNYKATNERNIGHYYTADFFVIRRKGAGWEEWKLEENLQKAFNKNPEKYHKDSQGKWCFPPGERYASSFGLYFHVHSSSEINWILFRNLKLLLPYYNSSFETTSFIHQAILASVENTPGITLIELFEEVEEAKNNYVFELILTKQIFVDLREAWLGENHLVRLFISKEVHEFFSQLNNERIADFDKLNPHVTDLLPGTTVRWNNVILEIMLISETEIMLRRNENDCPIFSHQVFEQFMRDGRITDFQFRPLIDKNSENYQLIQRFGSPQALAEALHRLKIIKPALNGKEITDKIYTDKTHRNWIKSYKRGEAKNGNGLLALIPHHYLKGNSTDRLEKSYPGLRQKMENFIETEYENVVNKTKSLAYGQFCILCETEGIQSPSIKTFIEAIKSRATPHQTEKMEGKKVAYQEEEFNNWGNGIPVHGDRPWEFAHLDHTLVDVDLLHSEKDIHMGSVWLSLLIDSFSRIILAYYLTFDDPSYRSCMCIVRECVRLHGRLPECFIVDGGGEFQGIYFEKLLARYKCDVLWRPPTKPRYGAVIERFIHTLNKQFIHNLRGNTKIMKKVRQITKEVNPENHAIWNLPHLDLELENYFYKEYPNQTHSGLGQTPNQAYAEGMTKFPEPIFQRIAYDDDFLIDTMPNSVKGTAKLLGSRGIKFMGDYYRSNKLRRPELYGTRLEIRYDPFSRAHIYVFIGGEWVECYAPPNVYADLKNRTERETKILTEEQRQLTRLYGRNSKMRLIELARNQARREESESLLMQRLRDEELRKSADMRGFRLSPGRSHLTSPNVAPTTELSITNENSSVNEDSKDSAKPVKRANLIPFKRAMKFRKTDKKS